MTQRHGGREQVGAGERYRLEDLHDFTVRVLAAVGCSPTEASIVARSLVEADARGLPSHGLMRLPLYTAAVREGGIVPNAPMRWMHEAPAAGVLDAAFGFGQTAMSTAVGRVAELASLAGCAAVGVQRSTHFGIGATWVTMLAERGLAGMVMSNTGPSVAPHGARLPLLGTNPIAVAFPVAGAEPVVLDMATSAAAYGRIVAAQNDGNEIPVQWALDADGAPTTDARAALGGALRPFGEHKGSGLGLVVEALAGALSGALFSFEITDIWRDRGSRMGTGHIAVAFDPRHFGEGERFPQRLRTLVDRVRQSPPAAGYDTVRLPGDVERSKAAGAAREGVELSDRVRDDLQRMAAALEIPKPPVPIDNGSSKEGVADGPVS